MSEFEKALADIVTIRSRLAASAMFQGFGPTVIASTGGLAVAVATLQCVWPELFAPDQPSYLMCWIITAIVCAGLIGAEMIARSRRIHGGLADAMVVNAVENFLPAGIAGAAISLVLFQFAPETLWILPGLWQALVSLGIFSAVRSLPPSIRFVGAWYLLSGMTVMMLAAADRGTAGTLDPWLMGAPFAIGQLLTAVLLWRAGTEGDDGEI